MLSRTRSCLLTFAYGLRDRSHSSDLKDTVVCGPGHVAWWPGRTLVDLLGRFAGKTSFLSVSFALYSVNIILKTLPVFLWMINL